MTTRNCCGAAFMTLSAISRCCFWSSASDTLAVACTAIEWGSHQAAPHRCARSSSVTVSVTQSATCKYGPQGPLTFVQTLALPRLHRRCNRHRSCYVAMTVTCAQVGHSVAIDCPCRGFVQARGHMHGPGCWRFKFITMHYIVGHYM